jgi:hypothetical protein
VKSLAQLSLASRNKLNVEFRLIYLCHPPITSTNHFTSNLQLTMCVLLPIIDLIYQTMEVSSEPQAARNSFFASLDLLSLDKISKTIRHLDTD